MRGRQRLELAHQLGMTAESELGVDPLLDADEPQLLQAADLVLRPGLVREVCERRSAPEPTRLLEGMRCIEGTALVSRVTSVLEQRLATMYVERLRI